MTATQLAAQSHYDEALALYQAAYKQSREARLLLNIGRCYYRLAQPRKALESYEEFRRAQPNPEPELASRLNQFVAEAKLAVLTSESESASSQAAALPAELEPAPAPLSERADGKTLLGRPAWRVGVAGGAVAVGGLLFGLGVGALAAHGRCLMPSQAFAGQCATQLDASGNRSTVVLNGVTAGVPMFLSGVLLITGGALLFFLPNRANKHAFRTPALRAGFAAALIAP